jgi:FemAB-related protein (PEP-CTERM system-associated)
MVSVLNSVPSRNAQIVIRQADSADELRWDDYVLTCLDASPYHLFAWKAAIETTYGHRCYYLYAEQDKQVVGILPLVRFYLPSVVDELIALPYCDLGACLSTCDQIQDALLRAAVALQQQLKVKKLHLRGPLLETELKNRLLQPEATGKVRMLLDLPPSAAELFAGFKSKLRSQIRKAEKNGVMFRWGGREDLADLYAVFAQNMRDLGSPVHRKQWLDNVLVMYAQRAKAGLVYFENKPIGMGIILMGGQGVSIPWASTLRDYNHLNPNMFLYWNFLQFSADHGFAYFDFGRSTEDEGTYKFKRQWGATPKPLCWYTTMTTSKKNSTEPPHSKKRHLAAALWRKLPLALANTVGPFIRKYISL